MSTKHNSHTSKLNLLKRNRNFRYLFIGQLISFLGTMITYAAVPYQIYQLTHSTIMVGLLSLSQLIPILLTSLFGGALADRHHRKPILLVTESILSLGCLALSYNSIVAHPSVLAIFIISVIMSAVNGLHRPALDSLVQQLVSKKDMSNVGALGTYKFSTGMLVGPAIGACLIVHLGLTSTFIVDFLSFTISLICILFISYIPFPRVSKPHPIGTAVKEGIQYAMSRQELFGSYLIDFVAMVFAMPTALYPAIAHSYDNTMLLGFLYSAPALGSLVVAITSSWVNQIHRHGKAIAYASICWGITITGFGLMVINHHINIALIFLCLAGASDGVSGIFRSTLWNQSIPSEYRGRLAGIEMISYLSGPKLGDTQAGILAGFIGIPLAITAGGILSVCLVSLCCFKLPRFWIYRSEVE